MAAWLVVLCAAGCDKKPKTDGRQDEMARAERGSLL